MFKGILGPGLSVSLGHPGRGKGAQDSAPQSMQEAWPSHSAPLWCDCAPTSPWTRPPTLPTKIPAALPTSQAPPCTPEPRQCTFLWVSSAWESSRELGCPGRQRWGAVGRKPPAHQGQPVRQSTNVGSGWTLHPSGHPFLCRSQPAHCTCLLPSYPPPWEGTSTVHSGCKEVRLCPGMRAQGSLRAPLQCEGAEPRVRGVHVCQWSWQH